MRNISKEELKTIIKKHKHWIKQDTYGWESMKANLSNANLQGVNLSDADLSYADLSNADLSYANLYNADLSYANLYNANLRGADLSNADLRNTDLRWADLSNTDLRWVDLRNTDLRWADLSDAINIPFIPMTCPDKGSFIGYKKCRDDLIVELEILADAKRSSATGRKCRCDKAKVLSITEIDGSIAEVNFATSHYDESFKYIVGEMVTVDNFYDNRFDECAPGIHFFINRQEAVNYNF